MNGRFFITGLPRSRTAWLANLFTVQNSQCVHEPSHDFATLDDLGTWWESATPSARLGLSDHGMGWWLEEIIEAYQPRVLLIERPAAQAYAALRAMGMPDQVMEYLRELQRRQNLMRSHADVLCVPFHKLDDARTMERAWFHVLPGIPFDEGRFHYLKRFNIQLTESWLTKCAKANPPIYRECADFLKEKRHA